MKRILCVLLGCCLLAFSQDDKRFAPAFGGRRLALVIGNKSYAWKPLINPVNDATAVARTLGEVGFAPSDVHLVFNTTQAELRRAVLQFLDEVKPGDLAFVYYSGHGVEVRGANYLLPVDLPSDATEDYVEYEAVSAQKLLQELDQHGAKVRVLVLDACRDNPLRAAKSTAGGLAPMEGRGSLIVFATEAGRTAGDTPGQANSVFTRYLLDGLRLPGVPLDEAMKRVAKNVAQATNEKQVPAIYGLMLEDVILVKGESPATSTGGPVVHGLQQNGAKARSMQPGTLWTNLKDGLRYAWIPRGSFMMGCSPGDEECYDSEKPAKEVTISKGFWLGESEVTQAAYERVTGKNPSQFKGADHPVERVTWDDAGAYCRAIGGRLPTEAEWEYAARAGTTEAQYGDIDKLAWYGARDTIGTHPVMQKEENAWGLYDTLGNVSEWTDGEGDLKPARGGNWITYFTGIRLSARGFMDRLAEGKGGIIGFRCAIDHH